MIDTASFACSVPELQSDGVVPNDQRADAQVNAHLNIQQTRKFTSDQHNIIQFIEFAITVLAPSHWKSSQQNLREATDRRAAAAVQHVVWEIDIETLS